MNKAQKEARKEEIEQDSLWSRDVKVQDGFRCAICQKNGNLNSHHIVPREDRRFRHDLRNGVTLCFLHHKFSLEISPHKNAFAFFLWLMKTRPLDFAYLKEKYENVKEM